MQSRIKSGSEPWTHTDLVPYTLGGSDDSESMDKPALHNNLLQKTFFTSLQCMWCSDSHSAVGKDGPTLEVDNSEEMVDIVQSEFGARPFILKL